MAQVSKSPVFVEKPPQGLRWKDLLPVSRAMTLHELTLPLPWLAGSLILYASPYFWLGPIASFMFFLCALRLNHEAIHGNLSLNRKGDHVVMHILSALMLGSNSAEAYCHLQHHKHAGSDDDHEGKCSHMRWYEVLAYGPRFPLDIARGAWRSGGAKWRARIKVDAALLLAVVVGVVIAGHPALYMHLGAMIVAQSLAAFFAVWITHQGTGAGLAGRSQRGPLAKLAHLMFYHREHHLFPKVPVSRLPELAARLDHEAQGYARSRKPVIPWLDWA